MDILKKLKLEEEIDTIFRNQEAKLAASEQAREEELKKRKAIQTEHEMMQVKFAKVLLRAKTPISEIIKQTGLSENEILNLD